MTVGGLITNAQGGSAALLLPAASWLVDTGQEAGPMSVAANGDLLRCTTSTGPVGDSVSTVTDRRATDGSPLFTDVVSSADGGIYRQCLSPYGSDSSTVRPSFSGTAYYLSGSDTSNNAYVMAYDAGTELWRAPVDSVHPRTTVDSFPSVLDIQAGVDGTVYALEWVENGFDVPGGDEYYVEAFDRLTGVRKWRWAFPSGEVGSGHLFVTQAGLVAAGGSGVVRWFDNQGNVTAMRTAPSGAQNITYGVTPGGTVVFARSGDAVPGGTCDKSGGVVGSLSPTTTTDIPIWSTVFPATACHIWNSVDPLPDGGAVLTNALGGGTIGDLMVVDQAGLRWQLPDSYAPYADTSLAVDSTGRILFPQWTRVDCSIPDQPGVLCAGVELDVVSATDGASLGSHTFAITGPSAVTLVASYLSTAAGVAYVAGNGSAMPANYPPRSLLGSVPISEFGQPWPRSALGGSTPTGALSVSGVLAGPNPKDMMLRRGLKLIVSPPGTVVTSFDYGWSRPTGHDTAPTVGVQHCTSPVGNCTVSFRAVTPNAAWHLWVRVTAAGATSPWRLATDALWSTTITTPSTPILVALGDSITSGHHRPNGLDKTVCNDPSYGYPAHLWNSIEASLPAQWRGTGYYNFARSKYSTNDMINGGVDGCNQYYGSSSPLSDASAILAAHRTTWARVVVTGGIDDTNWVMRLIAIAIRSGFGQSPIYSSKSCTSDLASWDGSPLPAQSLKNIHIIVDTLGAAAPARIDWIGYYNIAPPMYGYPPIPPTCGKPFAKALRSLDSQIRQASAGPSTHWVDVSSEMSQNLARIQPWTALDTITNLLTYDAPGWPHPNSAGAAAMANAIVTRG